MFKIKILQHHSNQYIFTIFQILTILFFIFNSYSLLSQDISKKTPIAIVFNRVGQKATIRNGENISIVYGTKIKPEYCYLAYSPGKSENEYIIELKSYENVFEEIGRLHSVIDSLNLYNKHQYIQDKKKSPDQTIKGDNIINNDSIHKINSNALDFINKVFNTDHSIFDATQPAADLKTLNKYLQQQNKSIDNNYKVINANKDKIEAIKQKIKNINWNSGSFDRLNSFFSEIDSLVAYNNLLFLQNNNLTETKAYLEKAIQVSEIKNENLNKQIKYLIGISLLALIIAFAVYFIYRTNKKFNNKLRIINEELNNSNLQLSEQNNLIQNQISQLSVLHFEKDKLLNIINKELKTASLYIHNLIPKPIFNQNDKISTDWIFIPSTDLGGDSLGYRWISKHSFAFYLLDVSGHGIGPALHSVQVLNTLQHKTLPNVDFTKPDEVLTALNKIFQMKDHNEIYFTLFYGVYDTETGLLNYAGAGHPAALLINRNGTMEHLESTNIFIGALPNYNFKFQTIKIEKPASIYIYSDGVYEIINPQGIMFTSEKFEDSLIENIEKNKLSLDCLFQEAIQYHKSPTLDDDYSLLKVEFL
ncbi:MAG: SpoIIE family protein phosphatase [Candidatus Kapabacteria bacterium]|nr:SpoIIE family protein phosphatase [Candidatus Kapabacteria bacterium]